MMHYELVMMKRLRGTAPKNSSSLPASMSPVAQRYCMHCSKVVLDFLSTCFTPPLVLPPASLISGAPAVSGASDESGAPSESGACSESGASSE